MHGHAKRHWISSVSTMLHAIVNGFVTLYPWKLLLLPPPPSPLGSMEQALERVNRAFNRSWAETKMTFEYSLRRANTDESTSHVSSEQESKHAHS